MENQYIIKGGTPLHGEVTIGGAKNAALGILAAAIMTDETVLIDNLPDVRDINVLLEAISGIGAVVKRINPHLVKLTEAPLMMSQLIMKQYVKYVAPIICLAPCLASIIGQM